MCLLALWLGRDPAVPLIAAANRDEFFGRPAAAPAEIEPGIVAGQDLQAGGTWLGSNRDGLFVAVTNRRQPARAADSYSRGLLALEALRCRALGCVEALVTRRTAERPLAGFNLVAVLGGEGVCFHWDGELRPVRFGPGLHVVSSNRDLDDDARNTVLVRHEVLDWAVLSAISAVLDARLLEEAVDRALARLREGQEINFTRRTQLERDLSLIASREQRLVDAIARGDALDPLVAALKAEQERKRALTADLDGLAQVGRVVSLDAERIKHDLRARVADVRTLLSENTQQGRAMLRKLLDGPIEIEPIREAAHRGFRFQGTLTMNRLITGKALTSLTGHFAKGRSAGARAPGPLSCGCRRPGSGSPRSAAA